MNCPSCKKPISEDASFCQYCGASIKAQEKPVEEFGFKTFVIWFPPGKGGSYSLKDGTEFAARAFFWGVTQEFVHKILATIAPMFVPISEVGPGAVKLRYHSGGIFSDEWVEKTEIRIALKGSPQSRLNEAQKRLNEIFREMNKKGEMICEITD